MPFGPPLAAHPPRATEPSAVRKEDAVPRSVRVYEVYIFIYTNDDIVHDRSRSLDLHCSSEQYWESRYRASLGEHAGQTLSTRYPTPLLLIHGSALLRSYHLTRLDSTRLAYSLYALTRIASQCAAKVTLVIFTRNFPFFTFPTSFSPAPPTAACRWFLFWSHNRQWAAKKGESEVSEPSKR